MAIFNQLHTVIMAGGSGTRFWPRSRSKWPKQFLSVGTESPLIVESFKRLDSICSWKNRWVVAGEVHAQPIQEFFPHLLPQQLLIEPCPRNTLPCVALSALHLRAIDPDALMAVFPADHYIEDIQAFEQAVQSGIEGAANGSIVTFGIKPTEPETGYGYIQYAGGGVLNQTRSSALRFVEKPPRMIAESYFASGDYLWNSGIFFFSVERILKEIYEQNQDYIKHLELISSAIGTSDYERVLQQEFSQLRSVSIDVGVMEGAQDVEVIPVSFGWSDVGHWGAIRSLSPQDQKGNISLGSTEHLFIDAQNNTIFGDITVALLGVEGLTVVQTEDALLVCPTDRAQDVRLIVEALKSKGKRSLT